MSGYGQTVIASAYGQISPLLVDPDKSIFHPVGWKSSNILYKDESAFITRSGPQGTWGQTTRFVIPKRAALVGPMCVEIQIGAGVLDNVVGRDAAMVNYFGDALVRQVTLRYGSHIIQQFSGDFQRIFNRLTKHSVLEEGRDLVTLGNLDEATRRANVLVAHTLYVPLDELYWCNFPDEYFQPESLAAEFELEITLAPMSSCYYSNDGNDPFLTGAGGTAPTINLVQLRPMYIDIPNPEKAERLAQFEDADGHLVKFLDVEQQINNPLAAGAGQQRVALNNIRLDCAELIFFITQDWDTPWVGDRYSSDLTNSIIVPGTPVNCLIDINTFRLESAGQQLTLDVTGVWNRAITRARWHPEAQVGDFIFSIPFAWQPENRKDGTGHINCANLSNLEIVFTPAVALAGTENMIVYSHAHNILQFKNGDVSKSLQ